MDWDCMSWRALIRLSPMPSYVIWQPGRMHWRPSRKGVVWCLQTRLPGEALPKALSCQLAHLLGSR